MLKSLRGLSWVATDHLLSSGVQASHLRVILADVPISVGGIDSLL
jgi:hypothetical protein